MTSRRSRIALAYGMFLLAGIAALGYQVIWARMLLAGMGHEMPALVAVVAAFMVGLAAGAWVLDRPISRSRRPARWFSTLQLVAGAWGLFTIVLIPGVNSAATSILGTDPSALAQWAVAFGFPAVALLPATTALGASFVAMERVVAGLSSMRRHVAPLYAVNTLGAAFGVLTGTALLMPVMGLRASVALFGCVLLLSAAFTILLDESIEPETGRAPARRSVDPGLWRRGRLLTTLAITGTLGIGYQVLVVHVLAQVLDDTIYTYATVLAVYLIGTALGASVCLRFLPEAPFRSVVIGLCGLLAATCLLGIIVLGYSRAIVEAFHAALPSSWLGRLIAETLTATLVFLAPTVVMGAMWCHLMQTARRPEGGLGQAIGVNALGAAAAPVLIGVVLLPIVGAEGLLVAIALGYLLLAPRPRARQWGWVAPPLALMLLLPANLHNLDLPKGAVVMAWRESLLGTAVVLREPDQNRTLRVDSRFQMGGTGSTEMAARHAHIPLLLHPAPRRALVLGTGTGLTLGAATIYDGLQIDGVELLPQVIGLMAWFEPENREANRNAHVRMHAADARRFVLATRDRYDVIIGDLFHPGRDGAGLLYTREHFDAIRRRLSPGGLFCQWLPLHQMDIQTVRLIARTFLAVFPDTQAWLLRFNVEVPVIGLVGYTTPPPCDPKWIEEHLDNERLGTELRAFALADSIRFFGHCLAGPDELHAFAGTGPFNTDDRPVVQFLAPRQKAASATDIHQRLATLLRLRQPGSSCWPSAVGESAAHFIAVWRDYVSARDVYLEGLIDEAEGRQQSAMDAFVESARLCREFTAGYAQCLTFVSLLAPSQPGQARKLLERLAEAQPAIPVARQMLERLDRPGVGR